MKWFSALVASAALTCTPIPASAEVHRDYICTVTQKAGIGAVHLEGGGTPEAFVANEAPTRFAMRITTTDERRFRAIERPYSGPDRDPYEWHTSNSVLHSPYLSEDGQDFVASEDQAFLRVTSMPDGSLRFYHAGFEYPGGEDTNLSVRWGTCVRQS